MIKKLLENHIVNNTPDESVALLLSGGIDSITVGLAAHNVGKKVHAYSFFLDGEVSYDFVKAAEVAHKMQWKFTPIVIPRHNLVDDFKKIWKLGCRKKTHYECVFPFLYIYPKIKEKYVMSGWGADGYFCVSKKCQMRYSSKEKFKKHLEWCEKHNATPTTFDDYRDHYFSEGECAGIDEHNKLVNKYKKKHITPYLDNDVSKHLMSMNYDQLNKGGQKGYVRKAFTKLKLFGNIKPHTNLHLGSGVDKLFETLLNNDEINKKGRKRMMDVCRDWYVKDEV